MMLGFKRRFAPFVEDGSKTHTIRAKRKNPFKVGKICDCYVDSRQKTMRLLGRWPCVKVEEISIGLFGRITIDGIKLCKDERNSFAWKDGFRTRGQDEAFAEMMEFWKGRLPFIGHVIHWDYTNAFLMVVEMLPGKRPHNRQARSALKDLVRVGNEYLKQISG